MKSLKKWGYTLKFASEDLKNNELNVYRAIKKNREFILYATEKLKNDKKFILRVLK
jgi:hypothetical protein